MDLKVDQNLSDLSVSGDTINTLDKVDLTKVSIVNFISKHLHLPEVVEDLRCNLCEKDKMLERNNCQETKQILKVTEKKIDMLVIEGDSKEKKIIDDYILEVKSLRCAITNSENEVKKEGAENDETLLIYSNPKLDLEELDKMDKKVRIAKDDSKSEKKDCDCNTTSIHFSENNLNDCVICSDKSISYLIEKTGALEISSNKLITRGPDKSYRNNYLHNNLPYSVMHPCNNRMTSTESHSLQIYNWQKVNPQYSPVAHDSSEGPDITNVLLTESNIAKDDDEGYRTASPSTSSPNGIIPISPLATVNQLSPLGDTNDMFDQVEYGIPHISLNHNVSIVSSSCAMGQTFDKTSTKSQEEDILSNLFEIVESLRKDYPPSTNEQSLIATENINHSNSPVLCNFSNISNCSKFNTVISNPNIPLQHDIPVEYVNSPRLILPAPVAPKKPVIITTECLLASFSEEEKRNAWFYVAQIPKVQLLNQDNEGDTMLHIAVCQERVLIVYTIVVFYVRYGEGKQINCQNQLGQTPLYLAAVTNQPSIVALLIQYGADPNVPVCKCKDLNSPLHAMATRGDVFLKSIEQLCVRKNVNLNIKNAQGYTPLHCAIINHGNQLRLDSSGNPMTVVSLKTVEFLIQSGADPCITDNKEGKSALHFAAEARDPNMIEVLKMNISNIQAIINCCSNNGDTPLHCAARLRNITVPVHINILRKLYECGANLLSYNKDNKRPSQLVSSSNSKVIDFLRGKGYSRLQAL